MFNENLIKQNRQLLGHFFFTRRKEMGHSIEHAAQHIGISANTLGRIENGKFAFDIDLLLKLCETYEVKPFFVPKEELDEREESGPKFLFAPDGQENDLYILHRHYPACLIEVVQTIPAQYKIVDIYELVDTETISKYGILEAAEKFFKEYYASKDQN